MALETKPFRNLPQLPNGTSVADNIKLTDCLPFQHTDINEGVNSFNKITMGQMLCEPVATAGAISGDTYSATCSNFPDFAISYTDEQQNSHYYVGMKVRVVFNNGITYGSVSGGTYPKLNINNSGAIPLLAQGKTMASGACSTGQSLEFTLIPYGNGVAWDADSNVRESTSDYTIYTDGSTIYNSIDSVTSGQMRPASSNSVYSAIKNKLPKLIYGNVSWNNTVHTFDVSSYLPDRYRPHRLYINYYSNNELGGVIALLNGLGVKIISSTTISGVSFSVSFSNGVITCASNVALSSCNCYIIADHN